MLDNRPFPLLPPMFASDFVMLGDSASWQTSLGSLR